MATNKLLGKEWIKELCEKLDLDVDTVRSIIIRVPHNEAVMVYVEQFGTKKLLDLEPPSAEFATIHIVGKSHYEE